MAEATGIDRAVEAATEEAIVRAVESPAVERALVRVLQGPAVEEAMKGALDSPAVERALVDALDSELVDTVWQRLLASDEAQELVERIAEAPEIRAAVAAQSMGLVEDIARQIRRMARRLDDAVERVARRLVRRERRTETTDRAGLVTRGVALGLDVGVLNVFFFAVSVVVALIASVVLPGDATAPALVVGLGAWLIAGSAYLTFFWALAGPDAWNAVHGHPRRGRRLGRARRSGRLSASRGDLAGGDPAGSRLPGHPVLRTAPWAARPDRGNGCRLPARAARALAPRQRSRGHALKRLVGQD